jgi:hypothetical protein
MNTVRALIAFVLLLVCCGSDCDPPVYLDEGLHVTVDGITLHPGVLPAAISADDTVEDATLLPEAVDQWNEWLSGDGVDRTVLVVAEPGETPRVTASVGYVPAPDWGEEFADGSSAEPLGIAYIDFAEDGEMLGAEIVISSDIAYDRDTVLQVLLHEVGHGFFGLADDPGPPQTVDLRSVMSSPMDPLGVLTDHDFAIIVPYLP